MFDCDAYRNARNGMLFLPLTADYQEQEMEDDFSPLDEMAITYVDTEYTKRICVTCFSQ
jgi:queuine tRNA-ribosyltransferase